MTIYFCADPKAYCERCGRYMKSKQLGITPVGIKDPGFWRRSQEAEDSHAAAAEEVRGEAEQTLAGIQKGVAEGDLSAVQSALFELSERKREANKTPLRIVLTLNACAACGNGFLTAMAHEGQGDQVATTLLATTAVEPELTKRLVGK